MAPRVALLTFCVSLAVMLSACGGGGGGGGEATTSNTNNANSNASHATPVSVESLLVTAGPVGGGTKLEIIGKGFFGAIRVMVGGREATEVHVSEDGTHITAMTPAAAKDITVADVQVISDTNGSATAPIPFQYQPPATITSISPARGPTAGSTLVTIFGTNFLGTVTVSFGGVAATGVGASSDGSQVVCTAPAVSREGAVDVVVTSSRNGSATVSQGYTYFELTPAFPPTVTSVIPGHGTLSGGTQITINGSNYRGNVAVTVGGNPATNVFVSTTGNLITCNVPASLSPGAKNVTVVNGDQTQATLIGAFTYDPALSITTVSPPSGPSSGGTLLTIDGTSFTGNLTVLVGGQPAASVTVNGARTRITCLSPPVSLGTTVDVQVLSDTNGSATSAGAFTYIDPPLTATGISPTSGPVAGQTPVTITGSAFLAPVTVLFGTQPATNVVIAASKRTLTCLAPAGVAAGSVDVIVSSPVNGSASLVQGYRYNAAPSITSVSPASGPLAGGTPVTVMGSGFFGNVTATIDGVAVSSLAVSAGGDVLQFNAPAAVTGTGAKVLAVTASLSGQTSSAFSYNALPSITNVSPASGFLEGGTAVTLSGSGFQGTVNVTFGNLPATVTGVNGTFDTITVVAPAGVSTGAVDVKVGASLAGSAVRSLGYNYLANPPPVINSVTPSAGTQDGGTHIVIAGQHFKGALSVLIDGQPCTGITANTSGTQIDCFTPATTSGAGGKTLSVSAPDYGVTPVPNGFTYNLLPSIAGLNPGNGPLAGGNTVIISGTNFGGNVRVQFGGFTAQTVNVSATQITCISPGGIAAGQVAVKVTADQNGTFTLNNGYVLNPPPVVSSVSPGSGPLAGGTPISITGQNFGTTANVTIDGRACTGVVVQTNLITCVTPPSSSGSGAKRLDIASVENGPLAVQNGFTYNPTPTITAIAPANGPQQGGTAVGIDGTGFTGTVNVTVGSVAANPVVVSGGGTHLAFSTPASATAGPANVIVTSSATGQVTAPGGFTYNAQPTITGLSPASGPTAGGTTVNITGTNFVNVTAVTFGNVAPQSFSVNPARTVITCVTAPSNTAGPVNVTVVSSSNGSIVDAGGFVYVPPQPLILSIAPSEGPLNTAVPIALDGFNFAGTVGLTVGGTACTGVTVNPSGTHLTCTVPPIAITGAKDVVLTSSTNGVTTSLSGYRVNGPPTITGFSPIDGPLAGGTTVNVTGTFFRGAASVLVGARAGTNVTVNVTGDALSFVTPAGTSLGVRDVGVYCAASGSVTRTNAFTYNPTPTVTAVVPGDGPQDGGTSLTINATNFVDTANPADLVSVTIGGAAATNVSHDVAGTQVFCRAPLAGSPGLRDVVVSSPSHGAGTLLNGYLYNPLPLITTITPSSGPLAGTNNVTIDGGSFLGTVNVTIDGQACVTSTVSSTRLMVTVPASTTGTGAKNVVIASSRAGSATFTGAYTYNPLPQIATITPNAGPLAGGTSVTIQGAFFGGTVTVAFGGTPATNVVVNASKTVITCDTPSRGATGPVAVSVTSSADGVVSQANGFTYNPLLQITGILPAAGPAQGGNTVTINGTNFNGAIGVKFGSLAATGVTVNATATQITCIAPNPLPAGGAFTVTVTSSLNGSATTNYFFNAAPQLDPTLPITPTNGPLEGGTPITVFARAGSVGFPGNLSVLIDGVPCTNVVPNVARTQITAITPAAIHGVGLRNVVVQSSTNGLATAVNAWRYNEQLIVTQIVPNFGPLAGGTTFNVTGAFFGGTVNVTIDTSPCVPVTVNSTSTLTTVSPPSTSGIGQKDVIFHSNTNGTFVVHNGWTYNPLPVFVGITPPDGPLAGGTTINVSGTGFLGNVNVLIGGQPSTNVTVNATATLITALTPPSVSGVGPKDVVVVTTGSGNVTQTNGFTYNPTPTVILMTPNQGPVAGGNTVTLDGAGYRGTLNVTIGGIACTNVTANVTGTQMTFTVPASPTGSGTRTMVIESSQLGQITGGNGISTFTGIYTYRDPPLVTNINPNNGPLAGGQVITITGQNLFGTPTVRIDGVDCTNVTATANGATITATTPAGNSIGQKDVFVNASASGSFTIQQGYTYLPPGTFTSITPNNGPLAGGTHIQIVGTNFNGTVTVNIGGNLATNVVVSGGGTVVDADIPASTTGPGAKTLTVTSSVNGPVTVPGGFTYNPLPLILSVNPNQGPVAGGNVIFINGTDFRGTVTATIGGQNAPLLTQSPTGTFISVQVPAHAAGAVNVAVNATLAGAVNLNNAYTYNPPPTFTSIFPNNGPQGGGTNIAISGTTFGGPTTVTIGGQPCQNVVATSSTTITAVTPPSINGTGARDVVITCGISGTVTATNAFTYNGSPSVFAIVPSSGPVGGGQTITITAGQDQFGNQTKFLGTVTVTIDGQSCTGVSVNTTGTQLTCVTPASATGTGAKDVTVNASLSGSVTAFSGYVYNFSPGFTSINPNEGPNQGGQQVTIRGSDFGGAVQVLFGPSQGTTVSVSPDQATITVFTPPFAGTGSVTLTIISPNNGTIVVPSAYTYDGPPGVGSITPSEGPDVGGTPMTITGSGFIPPVFVQFDPLNNGPFLQNVVINPARTQITGTTPAYFANAAAYTVRVFSFFTGTFDTANAFKFNAPPTILSIVPNNGPLAGGQQIQINGGNNGFAGTINVTIDGVAGVNPTAPTRNTILVTTPPAATGVGPKSVLVQTSSNGTSTAFNSYTYNPPPTITQINANNGPTSGGNQVTITGTGFIAPMTVMFGTSPGTVVTVNPTTSIVVTVPPIPLGLTPPVAVNVTVNSAFTGSATANNFYTYNVGPAATAVTPNSGPLAGGNTVTISGSNFGTTVNVSFGSVPIPTANVTVTGGNTITIAPVPASGTPGTVNIGIDSTQFGTLNITPGYTYNPLPTIASVTPNTGPVAGTATPITIDGTGFIAPLTVTIGGLAAVPTNVVSPTRITAQANVPGIIGSQDVVVDSTPAGRATLVRGFTYTPVFNAPVTFDTGNANDAPDGVAAADINGDGRLDFVTANQLTGTVTVLFSNINPGGTGIGGTAARFTVGTEPAAVAIADFNLDGKPDIVTANRVSDDITVLLNQQTLAVGAPPTNNPTFSTPFSFAGPASGNPAGMVVADFNGDGKPDVAVTDSATGKVRVYLNTTVPRAATPTFTSGDLGTTFTTPVGIAAADLDGDGLPDLVVANKGTNQVFLLKNTIGAGNFSPTSFSNQTPVSTGGTAPNSVAIGDLNGDGLPDVVAANIQSDSMAVLLHPAAVSGFGYAMQPVFTTDKGPIAITIADLDGEGVPDIITANDGGNTVSVRLNQTLVGTMAVTLTARTDLATGNSNPAQVLAIDANGDGRQDLVYVNRVTHQLAILYNTTPEGFTPATVATKVDIANGGLNPGACVSADFNGDGKADLIVVNPGTSTISAFTNTSASGTVTPTFTRTAFTLPNSDQGNSIAFGDLNGDGKPDLVVGVNSPSEKIVVMFNNSTAGNTISFTAFTEVAMPASSSPAAVAIGDFDLDGKKDIAVALSGGTAVRVLILNTTLGTTTFSVSASANFTVGSVPLALAVGDINGDGVPDIVAANSVSNSVSILQNGDQSLPTGNVSFSKVADVAVGAAPTGVAIAHVSSNLGGAVDLKPDVVTSNLNGTISLLQNTTGDLTAALTFVSPQVSTVDAAAALAIGELNGDGLLDVVTANGAATANTGSILLNTGGAYNAAQRTQLTLNNTPRGVAVGDFNVDYHLDIAITNSGSANISILRNVTVP